MKLATLRDGTRDGALAVVARDLTRAVRAESVVAGLRTLQQLLDDWDATSLKVQRIYAELNEAVEGAREAPFETVDFDPARCAAPLPRAYQWADGSAYVNHVELVRRARGADMPASFWTEPLMYQGGSDAFLGPCEAIELADEAWGIDLEGEVAAVTDDVAMGASVEAAGERICLLMLANDVSLRNLTPDELGPAWRNGKVHLPLLASLNGGLLGRPNAGVDMTFSFPQLIAHAAKTRRLGAGTIVGSGTVSNKLDGGPGKPVEEGGAGYTCLAELRTVETLVEGKPSTPFLKFGDRVRIEMLDEGGHSIFGAIEQEVVRYAR
jgi:fumarylacetoacetate (FAA) hydrolase